MNTTEVKKIIKKLTFITDECKPHFLIDRILYSRILYSLIKSTNKYKHLIWTSQSLGKRKTKCEPTHGVDSM